MKKKIVLEAIDPVEIYGPANKLLEIMCGRFPELKVVARGNELLLEGSQADVTSFNAKLDQLVEKRMHKRSLSRYDVEALFDEGICQEQAFADGAQIIVHNNEGKPVKARNATQEKMVRAYFENDLTFAIGPAGTGKTYIAIALAVRALKLREVKRIILTRPAVEAGERLGFLPGDLKDKLDPYLQPLYDALGDMIPPRKLQEFITDGTIQIAPLAYMRGRTLDRACVILDEAQNTNLGQLKMFLTRMGRDAKFIVTGDATQIDLPNRNDSGLIRGMKLLKGIPGICTIEFTNADIVRHPLVTRIVKAFDAASQTEITSSI